MILAALALAACTNSGGSAPGDASARVVEPSEAVANLEAEGTFRFVAESQIETQGRTQGLAAEGVVDLPASAARYTGDLSETMQSQGVVAVGRDLYVPGEQEGTWTRSRREGSESPWVEERFLPYDGGGLVALAGLRDADLVEVDPTPGSGRACATARGSDGTAELRYCVDDAGRLRSVRASSPEGFSDVRYEDLGEPVDIAAPPPDRVTDFDDTGAPGDAAP